MILTFTSTGRLAFAAGPAGSGRCLTWQLDIRRESLLHQGCAASDVAEASSSSPPEFTSFMTTSGSDTYGSDAETLIAAPRRQLVVRSQTIAAGLVPHPGIVFGHDPTTDPAQACDFLARPGRTLGRWQK